MYKEYKKLPLTLGGEQHFCPCSWVPVDSWTWCRGVGAAHQWVQGGCWAFCCGAPGADLQAPLPAAGGLPRTQQLTPAHDKITVYHRLSLAVLLKFYVWSYPFCSQTTCCFHYLSVADSRKAKKTNVQEKESPSTKQPNDENLNFKMYIKLSQQVKNKHNTNNIRVWREGTSIIQRSPHGHIEFKPTYYGIKTTGQKIADILARNMKPKTILSIPNEIFSLVYL